MTLVGNVKQTKNEEKSGPVETRLTGLVAKALYSDILCSTLSLVENRHLQLILTICFLLHCEVDNNFAIAIRKTSQWISNICWHLQQMRGSEITCVEHILSYIHVMCQWWGRKHPTFSYHKLGHGLHGNRASGLQSVHVQKKIKTLIMCVCAKLGHGLGTGLVVSKVYMLRRK